MQTSRTFQRTMAVAASNMHRTNARTHSTSTMGLLAMNNINTDTRFLDTNKQIARDSTESIPTGSFQASTMNVHTRSHSHAFPSRSEEGQRKGFSTAVYVYPDDNDCVHREDSFSPGADAFDHSDQIGMVLGTELGLKEAVAIIEGKNSQTKEAQFDKILLLIGHGETEIVTEEITRRTFGKKEGDICLTTHVSCTKYFARISIKTF